MWNCDVKVEESYVDNHGCSPPEKWFGAVYGLVNFLSLLLYTRIFSTIIFIVALCKITRIVGKIAQFGVVKNVWMLRGHVVLATFDTIGSIFSAYYSVIVLHDSIRWKE